VEKDEERREKMNQTFVKNFNMLHLHIPTIQYMCYNDRIVKVVFCQGCGKELERTQKSTESALTKKSFRDIIEM
jgi:hypothetical protein